MQLLIPAYTSFRCEPGLNWGRGVRLKAPPPYPLISVLGGSAFGHPGYSISSFLGYEFGVSLFNLINVKWLRRVAQAVMV